MAGVHVVGGEEGGVEVVGDVVVGTVVVGSVVAGMVVCSSLDVVGIVVVVVVALMMRVPNSVIWRSANVARVRYPFTVRCTPSAMNRLTRLGRK